MREMLPIEPISSADLANTVLACYCESGRQVSPITLLTSCREVERRFQKLSNGVSLTPQELWSDEDDGLGETTQILRKRFLSQQSGVVTTAVPNNANLSYIIKTGIVAELVQEVVGI